MKTFSIVCSSCRKKMPWKPTKGYPKECVHCGFGFGPDRDDDDVVMPFVSSAALSKAHDQVYRQMEQASEQRVADAAAITGSPASELSHLKITDLRPTKIPGSVAAPPLPQHLANVGGFQQTGNEWAGAVKSGPHPNAGAKTMHSMQRIFGRG